MGNKINLSRYYELLDKITQSEKKFNETAYGSYLGIVNNLNVADLNRQCRRPSR